GILQVCMAGAAVGQEVFMTEELRDLCTDLIELFMKQDFGQMESLLLQRTEDEVRLLAEHQHDILAKYYEEENYGLLLEHLNFVAFASYLFEYAGKRGVFTPAEFKQGFQIFMDVYELAKKR
ncbi:MAG: hypothetical protein K2N63_11890, partial [Lachnospiraceae bacterium]|nr:hypothetical protein [Lachnospiraceae bacterium]